MIVRPRPSLLGLFFILRGSIVPTIAPRLAIVAVLATIVAAVHAVRPGLMPDVTVAPFTLFGLALSIFLGFRNNACYERWWEGRRQWGQLIAEVRGFARDVVALVPNEHRLWQRLTFRTVAFAHALRNQLRGAEDGQILNWLPEGEWPAIEQSRSRADAVFLASAADLRWLMGHGALSDMRYRILSERLMAMTSIQTACERLRATPPPYTYSLLLHRTAWLFCLMLPFGLVSTLGFFTPVLTVVLGYAFFGLDALGDELEEPFGLSANALPLDALVRAIEIAAAEAVGETVLPEPLEPVDYVLR